MGPAQDFRTVSQGASFRLDSRVSILTVAVVAAVAIVLGYAWFSAQTQIRHQRLQETALILAEKAGAILVLDEVLTMSARMAVASGDPQWEARYRANEPLLDELIQETIQLDPSSNLARAAASTDDANQRLVQLEHEALALARTGRNDQALALLESEIYIAEKSRYAHGMSTALAEAQQRLATQAAQVASWGQRAWWVSVLGGLVMALGWGFTVRTVADLRRTQGDLRAATEEAEIANGLKSEFVGAISHELRSPLNVIVGYVDMALDEALGPLTKELRGGISNVRRESLALLEMITALLDLNRFESGRVPIERELVEIAPLLHEVTRQIPDGWQRDGVAVRIDASDALPPVVTDRGKVKTVIRNLLHNALKFTEQGEIRIAANETRGGDIAVVVEDTGCGIPASALRYVFDLFRQVPGVSGGGVGLGLHLVRRLVDAIGGTVTVTSRVGTGTRFTVVVPANVSL